MMENIPFLWFFIHDSNENNATSEYRERATESANEETNTHSIEFN